MNITKLTFVISITVILLTCPAISQFKTEFNENGDPLSEITDDSMMKQGNWNYFDNKGNLVKIENYLNNELLSSKLVSAPQKNKEEIDITAFSKVEVKNDLNSSNAHGEFIYDGNGNLITAYFYHNSVGEEEVLNQMRSKLEQLKPNRTKVIFIF